MEDNRNDTMENSSLRERAGDFLRDKGVYLVLLICIAIVGIAAAAAYMPEPEPEAELQQTSHSADQRLQQVAPTLRPAPALTARPTAEPASEPTPEPTPDTVLVNAAQPEPTIQPEPAATATPAREKAAPPVKGPVQWRFANDELVYSKTLDQWMTHSGVDISSSLGAEVHAVWAGTVDEVYRDDGLGVSIRLVHGGGLESLYANLRSDVTVKEGEKVQAGEVIGYVGDTAQAECGQDAHLHFEVVRDGKLQDPMEHIIVIEE